MIEEQRHSNLVSWRLVIAFSLFVIVVVAVIWNFVGQAQHQIIEFQARELAEVVARQAASSRTVYTKHVVSKLSRDGFGADLNSEHRRGYVPLPAQFMKLLGEESRKRVVQVYTSTGPSANGTSIRNKGYLMTFNVGLGDNWSNRTRSHWQNLAIGIRYNVSRRLVVNVPCAICVLILLPLRLAYPVTTAWSGRRKSLQDG